jgi:hypothetical protein
MLLRRARRWDIWGELRSYQLFEDLRSYIYGMA